MLRFCIVFILLLISSILPEKVYASFITVSPSIARIDLAVDKPEVNLEYYNNSNNTIELKLSAQDFSELEDGQRVKFLEAKDAANYNYSLSSWIDFEQVTLILKPKEKKTIRIFIDEKNLTTGGHYGSILAELIQPSQKDQVTLRGILSSLIFVRTANGNEREEVSIQTFKPQTSFIEFPERFLLRLHNRGNVEITPYGIVMIKDPFGRTVAKGIVNEGSLITLPETIRSYRINLSTLETFYLPGFYRAELNMRFGKNKTDKKTVEFFSQGSIDLTKIGLVLLVVFIAAYLLQKIQRLLRP